MWMNVKRPVLVWGLLLVIVMVSGLMAAPSVGHAEHHADHQPSTHSTGVCAWLCAGGVGIESSIVQFDSYLQLLESVSSSPPKTVFSVVSLPYFFRGPPSLLS